MKPEIVSGFMKLLRWWGLALLWGMCPLELSSQKIRGRDLVLLAVLSIPEGVCLLVENTGVREDFCGQTLLWMLASWTPGVIMLLLSRLCRGSLGAGDGWLFLALGLSLCPGEIYLMCQLTFFLAGSWGLVHRHQQSLPLVPFAAVVRSLQLTAMMLYGGT